ncbi:hypothetical protein OEA41_008288 [Lepraria neglecta]|uniref:Uncharacterized protein n=1 Tax=Lepraria neglecta TaxID=209136 RepID=A0AAD9ZEF2_9LECA|nr:hypothetical protein OEA41_008288 [Lepraria neglecta]
MPSSVPRLRYTPNSPECWRTIPVHQSDHQSFLPSRQGNHLLLDSIKLVLDPPRTLSPATAMVPQPTKAGPNPTDTAAPSPAGPSLPLETGAGISKPTDLPLAVDPQPKHGDPFPGDPGDPGDPGNVNPPQALLDGQTLQSGHGGPPADGPARSGNAEGSGPLPTFPPALAIDGQTITNGGPPVTISGTPIVYQSGSIRIGGQIQPISAGRDVQPNELPNGNADPNYITIGGQTIAVDPNAIIAAGTTLLPGDPGIAINGAPMSLGSSVIITITVAASSIVIAGHGLRAGGPAVMVDGTQVSIGSSVLVVGTETMGFTLPAVSASAESNGGIGAMIMYGLTGVGDGTVPAPVETGENNGTAAGNGTVAFMGGALNVSFSLKRWSIPL